MYIFSLKAKVWESCAHPQKPKYDLGAGQKNWIIAKEQT